MFTAANVYAMLHNNNKNKGIVPTVPIVSKALQTVIFILIWVWGSYRPWRARFCCMVCWWPLQFPLSFTGCPQERVKKCRCMITPQRADKVSLKKQTAMISSRSAFSVDICLQTFKVVLGQNVCFRKTFRQIGCPFHRMSSRFSAFCQEFPVYPVRDHRKDRQETDKNRAVSYSENSITKKDRLECFP